MQKLKEKNRRETTYNYIADCLRLINESIAKRFGGQYYGKPLSDILRSSNPPAKKKSAEEIIADVTQKAGLVVID